MRCDRCGRDALSFTTSYFNTDTICIPECYDKERSHPAYAEAKAAEAEARRRGDTNFPGVGKPADL